jgi:hypothetical protein
MFSSWDAITNHSYSVDENSNINSIKGLFGWGEIEGREEEGIF